MATQKTQDSAAATWQSLGVPDFLVESLARPPFCFDAPLAVQTAVLPFANRAFASWLLHCDVALASPTGSGKTLCYCLPMLRAVVEQRQRFAGGFPDRHIRGVVVVPTAVLAEQVHDVLTALCAPAQLAVGTLFRAADDGSALTRVVSAATGTGSQHQQQQRRRKRFGVVDIVVATPQKLCTWMEALADEDDEMALQQSAPRSATTTAADAAADPNDNNTRTIADVFGRTQVVVLDEADDLLSTSFFTSMAGRIVETLQGAVAHVGETVLHKMLCSATLTARISKVSDVKLQNARYYALDAGGADLSGRIAAATATSADGGGGGAAAAAAALPRKRNVDTVRPVFPLPSSLVENLVIVRDDSKRHVTLLLTVRHALAELQQKAQQKQAEQAGAAEASNVVDQDSAAESKAMAAANANSASAWRRSANNGGNSVIVFCQTAEVARVMGHFLAAAGVDALELTTLTSEAERRRAALSVATASAADDQKVIVVSDALMRGIDMPGVGAVIMYEPPTTLQQYIHRVGRTARAGAPGASYVLLSKQGPSGAEADGQVAHFRAFDAMLLRSGKVNNQVKLRELPEAEVTRADELLAQTQRRLNALGFFVSAAAAKETDSESKAKKGSAGQRRGRR